MQKLNLPIYDFKIKKSLDNKEVIFDEIRKKYVRLTPEEWVRQNFVKYLIYEKNYPQGLISIEMGLKINNTTHRCDIVCFNKQKQAIVIIECKATTINIKQEVFEQTAKYNMILKTKYLIMTNGINHYCGEVDYINKKIDYLNDIPSFKN